MRVPLLDVAFDVRTSARTVSKEPRRTDLRVSTLNHASTMFNHDAPFGVKWKCTCIVRLARRQPRAQRQQGGRAAERLNLRLLIEAQHDGVGRRTQVQPHDVVDLVLGGRVGRKLEGLDPVRLQSVSTPEANDVRALTRLTKEAATPS